MSQFVVALGLTIAAFFAKVTLFSLGGYALERKARQKMVVDKTEIIIKNSDWYYANQDSFVPQYDGKFIAIVDCAVVGEYDTFANGVHAMLDAKV